MTQEQALEAYKKLLPADAESLAVERQRTIGRFRGYANLFNLWRIVGDGVELIQSEISWEHALSQVRRPDSDFPADTSEVEEDTAAALVALMEKHLGGDPSDTLRGLVLAAYEYGRKGRA